MPFSCEAFVGRFSRLDERALEEEGELQEALDHRVVRVVLHQVARVRHTERGRAALRGMASENGQGGSREDLPVRIKLPTRSVFRTQGK